MADARRDVSAYCAIVCDDSRDAPGVSLEALPHLPLSPPIDCGGNRKDIRLLDRNAATITVAGFHLAVRGEDGDTIARDIVALGQAPPPARQRNGRTAAELT